MLTDKANINALEFFEKLFKYKCMVDCEGFFISSHIYKKYLSYKQYYSLATYEFLGGLYTLAARVMESCVGNTRNKYVVFTGSILRDFYGINEEGKKLSLLEIKLKYNTPDKVMRGLLKDGLYEIANVYHKEFVSMLDKQGKKLIP